MARLQSAQNALLVDGRENSLFFYKPCLKKIVDLYLAKMKNIDYSHMPVWVSPMEVVANPLNIIENLPNYLMLLEKEDTLKSLQQLK